uniref:Oxidoreductase n=1 Tax=Schlesneria paludicola TaxID=360056 RepID=A0A7C4QXY3_9PLAN
MIDLHTVYWILGLVVVGGPLWLFVLLGLSSLIGRPLGEAAVSRWVQAISWTGLLSTLAILVLMLALGTRRVPLEFGNWVRIPHYHLALKIEFDRLSVPFAILSFLLCGTIGAFAAKYMHREPGFNRFHVLYALFLLGMILTSVAGTIETLFTGWELVGLSSALLVAFFQDRPAPVRNGLRVWTVYRVSDAALLLAAVALHHLRGEGDFDLFLGSAPWPAGPTVLSSQQAFLVGLLIVAAAAGKSALIPFCGWLPRAMEGPTPSSAVFYGALSVHLGAFLLLRVSPLLDRSPVLSAVVVAAGLATALLSAASARVQTDIKSALSLASLTQVGIIVAEIGLGLRYVPLIHILGHACLRTLQFVRAPSVLLDYGELENAIGGRLNAEANLASRRLSHPWRRRLYRFAFDRGHLDALLDDWCVRPLRAAMRWCDALERRWVAFLSRGEAHTATATGHPTPPLEELA